MTDKQLATITDRIMKAAKRDRREIVEDLVEELMELAKADGANTALIELADAGELTEDGYTAVDENMMGIKDPRR